MGRTFEQPLHACIRRHVQRRAAMIVRGGRVGAVRQQQFHDIGVAVLRSLV